MSVTSQNDEVLFSRKYKKISKYEIQTIHMKTLKYEERQTGDIDWGAYQKKCRKC